MAAAPLLEIEDLRVQAGERVLVDGVGLRLARGASLGLLGQSGSGKSLTALSVLGLLPEGLRRTSGRIRFDGTELSALDERGLRPFRGGRIALVFQEAMSAFNPVLRLGGQVAEVVELHRPEVPRRERAATVEALFEEVGLREPARVARSYPHELSGGMLQRCMIAMALAGEPELLIADEPTTALDVTVQARVLELVAEVRARRGLSLLWISHDLAVVARVCEEVVVLRDGRVEEAGPVERILREPQSDYARRLVAAAPRLEVR